MKLVKQQTEDWRAKQWKKKYGYKGKKEKKTNFLQDQLKRTIEKEGRNVGNHNIKKAIYPFSTLFRLFLWQQPLPNLFSQALKKKKKVEKCHCMASHLG